MMKRNTNTLAGVMSALLFLAAPHAMAQSGTGAIAGIVRDASGSATPGATIRVVNEVTGAALEAVSGEQGAFRVEPLAPGRYRIETTDGLEPSASRAIVEAGQTATVDVTLAPARVAAAVVVTARRVEEVAQEVPIPVSVVSGRLVDNAGAFNVNRLKELIPTVQFYSTNPRNSAVNIRIGGSQSERLAD
jgi:iron complex outermembrane receptor protein